MSPQLLQPKSDLIEREFWDLLYARIYSVWIEYSDSSKEAASVANDLCNFTLDLAPSISWPKRHNLMGFRSGLNFDEGMMFYLQDRIQRLYEQEHPDNPMGHGLILLDPLLGNNYQGFQDFDTPSLPSNLVSSLSTTGSIFLRYLNRQKAARTLRSARGQDLMSWASTSSKISPSVLFLWDRCRKATVCSTVGPMKLRSGAVVSSDVESRTSN